MSSDGGLGELFRNRLKPHDFWCQRIESGGTGQGIPDTHWIRRPDGRAGWVEFKQETALGVVRLRPEQISWIFRYARAGGRAVVAVRYWHDGGPRKGDPTDELWLMDGRYAREIRRAGLTEGAPWVLGRWLGGPGGWHWEAVASVLVGET